MPGTKHSQGPCELSAGAYGTPLDSVLYSAMDPTTDNRSSGRSRAGRRFALVLLCFAFIGASGESGEAPAVIVPCSGAVPEPRYSDAGAPPNVRTWTNGRLTEAPALGACTGWTDLNYRTLVAVAGTFRAAGGHLALLSRFGSVSSLLLLRYWSTTDQAWLPLVTAATPLTGEVAGQPRADFTAAELAGGQNFYMSQRDNRSASDVVYRMRVRESRVDRIVLETENVTAVRWWALTLFKPGALRTVYFLNQRSPDTWSYYALTKITDGSWLVAGHEKSYVNRVVALFRHLAGVPTDAEPPAAP